MLFGTITSASKNLWTASGLFSYKKPEFVMVDQSSTSGRPRRSAYSYNGTTWTYAATNTFPTSYDFLMPSIGVPGSGMMSVIPSSTSAYITYDGLNWSATASPLPSSNQWGSITTTAAGRIVVIPSGTAHNSKAAYTDDFGANWSTSSLPAPVGAQDWRGIAYGNGRLVVVGKGTLVTYSTNNGASWVQVSISGLYTPFKNWNAITYDTTNNRFVAIAETGECMYSTNGSSWSVAPNVLPARGTASPGVWGGLAYGNGQFIAVGSGGTDPTYAYSTDGGVSSAWTSASLGTGNYAVGPVVYGTAYSKFLISIIGNFLTTSRIASGTGGSLTLTNLTTPSLYNAIAYF